MLSDLETEVHRGPGYPAHQCEWGIPNLFFSTLHCGLQGNREANPGNIPLPFLEQSLF